MKRIFVEIDDIDGDEIETWSRLASLIATGKTSDNFFDEIMGDVFSKAEEVWEAVKTADEIYAATALIPHFGGYGGGTVFNNLMWKAMEENTEGKSVYLFRRYNEVRWDELDAKLVDKVFRKNFLYVHDENMDKWEQVDIDKLLKEELC